MESKSAIPEVDFATALKVHLKIGLLSFGGPAGQIALMQQEIVERRRWVTAASFDRGLSFAMMLPGPEAQQLATWLGWRLHGIAGGLAAGLAFILLGATLMIGLAWLAAAKGGVPLVAAVFAGVQPVVIALVLAAMGKIGGRALKTPAHWALAAAAFTGLYLLGLPFPLIVALSAAAGLVIAKDQPGQPVTAGPGPWRHFAVVAGVTAALVIAVFTTVSPTLGRDPFQDVAELFTTAAFVTSGGAYAVLPFLAGERSPGWAGHADRRSGGRRWDRFGAGWRTRNPGGRARDRNAGSGGHHDQAPCRGEV